MYYRTGGYLTKDVRAASRVVHFGEKDVASQSNIEIRVPFIRRIGAMSYNGFDAPHMVRGGNRFKYEGSMQNCSGRSNFLMLDGHVEIKSFFKDADGRPSFPGVDLALVPPGTWYAFK